MGNRFDSQFGSPYKHISYTRLLFMQFLCMSKSNKKWHYNIVFALLLQEKKMTRHMRFYCDWDTFSPKNQRFLYTKRLITRSIWYFERHLPNSNQLSRSFNVLFLVKTSIPHEKSVQNGINWFYVVHTLSMTRFGWEEIDFDQNKFWMIQEMTYSSPSRFVEWCA